MMYFIGIVVLICLFVIYMIATSDQSVTKKSHDISYIVLMMILLVGLFGG